MEDVLEVYHRQYGDNEVLVCLDETSKQQTKETRLPRPARPGASGVYDYEYERNGDYRYPRADFLQKARRYRYVPQIQEPSR